MYIPVLRPAVHVIPVKVKMKAGFYPFWFLNDRLEAGEIRLQVRAMQAQGVRGFFLHPRQGLAQPYLAEAFFAALRVAIDEAKACGMIANLYDEYPYPSGVAGGELLLGNPQWWGTALAHDVAEVAGGFVRRALPAGQVLCCKAFPCRDDGGVDWAGGRDLRRFVGVHLGDESFNRGGLTPYNRKRYFASAPQPVLEVELPAGRWRLVSSVQMVISGHKYWDRFVDVMNPQAVQAFIRLTHERYRHHFGAEFGRTIRAIFSDEVGAAWSAQLPPRFRHAMGYDLLERLEAVADPAHPDHDAVSADLARVKYQVFCESFEEPVRAWCARNGLAYCGEKNSFRQAQLAYMDIPGCEPGHTKVGAPAVDTLKAQVRGNARATAAAAYFYGKPGALCECFHSLGWGGTLQDAKQIAENLFLLGITILVPHGFFYSTHALRKHDAPPTFFFQMPYWPYFGLLSRRLDKIAAAFAETWIDAGVVVLDPNAGCPNNNDKKVCEALYAALMGRQVEFMIADTDILAAAPVSQGELHCRDLRLRQVLVPPMRAPEPALPAVVERLRQHGVDCRMVNSVAEAQAVADELAVSQPSSLSFSVENGDRSRLWMTARRRPGRRVWFLQNLGSAPVILRFSAETTARLREIVLDETAGPVLAACPEEGGSRCRLDPFASVLLGDAEGIPAAPPLPLVRAVLPSACSVTPLNANLLRLGSWQLALAQDAAEPWSPAVVVEAMPLANQLKQGRFAFRPEIEERFGSAPRLAFPSLRLRYTAEFFCRTDVEVALVMEPGSLGGVWRLELNETWRAGPEQFGPAAAGILVPGCLSLDIAPGLRPGRNRLVFEIEASRPDQGLRNPLYLAGGFAVRLDPLAIEPFSSQGEWEQYERNGLPFFAGELEYAGCFTVDAVPAEPYCRLCLQLPQPCEEAFALALNGADEWLPLPWNPRQAVIPSASLRPGRNDFRLRLATTLIRAFEGERFDIDRHGQVSLT